MNKEEMAFRLSQIVMKLRCEVVRPAVKRVPHWDQKAVAAAAIAEGSQVEIDKHAMKKNRTKRYRPSLEDPYLRINPETSRHAYLLEGLTDIGKDVDYKTRPSQFPRLKDLKDPNEAS